MESIADRARFDYVRYANCWEDSQLLVEALPTGPGRRILSIASAGDNSLRLLATGAEVVAVDLNLAQLACLHLRVAALRALDDDSLRRFLGFLPATDRQTVYGRIRQELPATSAAFWDRHPEAIEGGVIHAGKFENYFQLFRRRALPWVHSRRTVEALLEPRDLDARRQFYDSVWSNRRWRWMFRIFFSRTVMGRMGRDPEFFRYVDVPVAENILQRTRHALTELTTHDNPYLRYILTGTFAPALPDWVQPDVLSGIRENLDRLVVMEGGIEQAAATYGDAGFDGFNLSDIFEYLSPDVSARLYGQLLAVARPGARFAYWNMLVPRGIPEPFSERLEPLTDLSARLFARDRAFFYSAFKVDEVL